MAERSSEPAANGRARAAKSRSLAQAIDATFGSGDGRLQRLAAAGTSVAIIIDGSTALTLLLDRDPPGLVSGEEPAEVIIGLTGPQAAEFADGRLLLSTQMADGLILFRGPARKFLTVYPVLKALLTDLSDDGLTR